MYMFNSNLCLGDITLVRGSAKHSKIIAKVTKGHFSHAMISLENGRSLEAITNSGVQVTSNVRVSFKDKKNVVVLRCIFPNDEIRKNVLNYIANNHSSYQGLDYSMLGACKSITKQEADPTNGSYFCSQLVAGIYKDSGFPLLDKEPHKVTPNDLLTTNFLTDVTDSVLAKVSDVTLERMNKNNEVLKCIDDGGETLSKDALNHQILIKNTKKYFVRNGLAKPKRTQEFIDVLTDPQNVNFAKKLDYQISKEYKNIGINKHLKLSFSATNYSSDMKVLKEEIEKHGYSYASSQYKNCNALLCSFVEKNIKNKANRDTYESILEKFPLKYASLKLEYHNLISKAIEEIIKYHIDVCLYIEEIFPEHIEELKQQKIQVTEKIKSEQFETLIAVDYPEL